MGPREGCFKNTFLVRTESSHGIVVVMVLTPCPDFSELDVFLGQHILLTLEQHFNPKILS